MSPGRPFPEVRLHAPSLTVHASIPMRFLVLLGSVFAISGCAIGPGHEGARASPRGRTVTSVQIVDRLTVNFPQRLEGRVPPVTGAARVLTGTVGLRVHVTAEGTADSVVVGSPFHPSLDSLAAASVRAWRFQPGTRNGRPVAMWANVPVRFDTPDDAVRAIEADNLVGIARGTAMLPESDPQRGRVVVYAPADIERCTRLAPPRVATGPSPAYPEAERAEVVSGEAVVRIQIGLNGRPLGATVLYASRPAFGAAAAEAMQRWTFDAASCDGAAIAADLVVPMLFSAD